MSRAGCRRKAQAPLHHEGDLHGPSGVAWHVDVGIDHDHDLGPHVGGHGGQQGGARLAGEVLVHRHDDAEGDANRGRDGDLLEGRELLAHPLEEARVRQESCFRMWFSVGGHSPPIAVSGDWKTAPLRCVMAVTRAIGPRRGDGAAGV
jgi:hypothetical protein